MKEQHEWTIFGLSETTFKQKVNFAWRIQQFLLIQSRSLEFLKQYCNVF